MTNQQKQLQSILAEVGINLTERQTLAVMEANELMRCGDPSYSQVMDFKEKYAPKKQKQDGINLKSTNDSELFNVRQFIENWMREHENKEIPRNKEISFNSQFNDQEKMTGQRIS